MALTFEEEENMAIALEVKAMADMLITTRIIPLLVLGNLPDGRMTILTQHPEDHPAHKAMLKRAFELLKKDGYI